jgi:hypothetical protein
MIRLAILIGATLYCTIATPVMAQWPSTPQSIQTPPPSQPSVTTVSPSPPISQPRHPTLTSQTWYWCDPANTYYPNIARCPVPWRVINPQQPARTAASPPQFEKPTPLAPDISSLTPPKPTPPSVPESPLSAQSAFQRGLADRTTFEQWVSDITVTDYRAGVDYWAAQRSHPSRGDCSGSREFYAGCMDAKKRLAASDVLRNSQADYKLGWNAYSKPDVETTPKPPDAVLAHRECWTCSDQTTVNSRNERSTAAPIPPVSTPSSSSNPIITLFWIIFASYFAPTLIAILSGKRDKLAIFALNLLAGWTFIGWLIAFVWSLKRDHPAHV